jgi:hypothetical protein
MGGDNLLHDIQPKSGATRLGRVGGIKNPRQLLKRYATAFISHVKLRLSCRSLPDKPDGATRRHRLERIQYQIVYRPVESTRV